MAAIYDPDRKRQEEEYQKMLQQQRMNAQNYGGQGAGMPTYGQQAQNVPTYGQQAQNVPDYGQQTPAQTGAPSGAVMAAEQYLQGQQEQKAQGMAYNNYTGQLSGLLQQIRNGTGFQYDAATDPLYNIYKDLYIQNGRRAMQDTIGQAAALTGGYGNSYAQSAGQQQYGQYMEGLNAIIPQLQQQAFSQYSDLLAQDLAERQYQDNLALQWAQYNLDKAKFDWQTRKKSGSTPTNPTEEPTPGTDETTPGFLRGITDRIKNDLSNGGNTYGDLLKGYLGKGGTYNGKTSGTGDVLKGIVNEQLGQQPKKINTPWWLK